MIVACVGRRDLKRSESLYLESVGLALIENGHSIASGNAPGSDQAFALGASYLDPSKVTLYLPWSSFEKKAVIEGNVLHQVEEATAEHQDLARRAHPAWDRLEPTVRRLMVRNAMIVKSSAVVIAFPDLTKPGLGGTGHAMRCALELGIPVWLLNEQRGWYG